jgi:hypothetical protein
LAESVDHLEKVVQALIELYKEERVKNWEMILREMMKELEGKKGNPNAK